VPKAKRHLKVADPVESEALDPDEPVKLPDDFAEAIRVVLPVQATKADEPTEDDAR
jgi:hypothetical protein